MTEAFINAAELMASTLGADDHGFVVIDHPIASATAEALAHQAELAARSCVALLTSGPAVRS